MFGAALTPGTVLYVYILHCVSYCCFLSNLWSPPDTSNTTAAFFSVLLALCFWMSKTPFACERPVHIYQPGFFQACFCLNILWLDTTNLSLHLSHLPISTDGFGGSFVGWALHQAFIIYRNMSLPDQTLERSPASRRLQAYISFCKPEHLSSKLVAL